MNKTTETTSSRLFLFGLPKMAPLFCRYCRDMFVIILTIIIFLCVFVTAAFTRIETVFIVLVVIAASVVWTLIVSRKPPAAGEGSGTLLQEDEKKGGTK